MRCKLKWNEIKHYIKYKPENVKHTKKEFFTQLEFKTTEN